MFSFNRLFSKQDDKKFKDSLAAFLKTSPEKLAEFEAAYKNAAIDNQNDNPENFFDINAKQASKMARTIETADMSYADQTYIANIISRIVDELTDKTPAIAVKDGKVSNIPAITDKTCGSPVTRDELKMIPERFRPELTGSLMKVDLNEFPSEMILSMYQMSVTETDPEKAMTAYHMFRQGMDIQDLDPILYEMLGRNKNTMSYWLPAISKAAANHGFFKIPETKIAKVPMPLLQLSRLDYMSLSPSTLKIVDEWAKKAFDLDENKTYFIKTGTYSSKYDFRNAKVAGAKEVNELGEYLLYIQHQATMMASPLTSPCIYSVSTTNEWVVREYIEDKENNPCIYMGMPLHTEYRVFVDFDTNEILGIMPYWEPETMKHRFSNCDDAASPYKRHDYIIYKMHKDTLMQRYNENKDLVTAELQKLLPDTDLTGQWSVDIMQNGSDFWLIDMATADTSALNRCIPVEKRKKTVENWLPNLT